MRGAGARGAGSGAGVPGGRPPLGRPASARDLGDAGRTGKAPARGPGARPPPARPAWLGASPPGVPAAGSPRPGQTDPGPRPHRSSSEALPPCAPGRAPRPPPPTPGPGRARPHPRPGLPGALRRRGAALRPVPSSPPRVGAGTARPECPRPSLSKKSGGELGRIQRTDRNRFLLYLPTAKAAGNGRALPRPGLPLRRAQRSARAAAGVPSVVVLIHCALVLTPLFLDHRKDCFSSLEGEVLLDLGMTLLGSS